MAYHCPKHTQYSFISRTSFVALTVFLVLTLLIPFPWEFAVAGVASSMAKEQKRQRSEDRLRKAGKKIVTYVEIPENILSNYYTETHQLGYVELHVKFQLESDAGSYHIDTHIPMLRDAIIRILLASTKNEIESVAGRETLRANTLKKLRAAMREETGKSWITEVLFTSFVIQKPNF